MRCDRLDMLFLRKTNQETRHSAWKTWEQVCSARMGSEVVDGASGGIAVASSIVGDVEDVGWRRAGSRGEGAWRVERQIALGHVSICNWY